MAELEKYFIFTRNHLLHALPLKYVLEVVEFENFYSLPQLNSFVIGLGNYRGQPIPIIDPQYVNGIQEFIQFEPCKNQNYIIIEYEKVRFAIVIDKFYKILNLNKLTDSEENLSVNQDGILNQSMIHSLGLLDNKTLFFLNLSFLSRKVQVHITTKIQQDSQNSLEKVSSTDSSASYKCLCFTIEEIQFAIPIRDILEVVDNLLVTSLFKVNPFLRGLINVRGRIYPCVDISAHLKLPYRPLNENTKFIILHHDDKELAICCDEILNMKDLSNNIIQNNEGLLEKNLNQISFGIANYLNETILLISSRAIIQSQELSMYKKVT